MKSDIHPESYRPVVFKDSASGFSFLSKSCARTTQTVKWEDGQEYPLVILGISSASHPFYTGQQVFVDTAGRVDKFQQRLAKTKEAQERQLPSRSASASIDFLHRPQQARRGSSAGVLRPSWIFTLSLIASRSAWPK